MKKKNISKIISSMILSSIVLLPITSLAATEEKNTESTVTFKENPIDPENPAPESLGLVKPGTVEDNIWVGNDGSFTTGSLRFSNIPHIRFGEVNIKAQSMRYDALMTTYQVAPNGEKPKETDPKINIPHFAQVVDERGTTGQFEVKVSATEFAQVNDATKKLKNTRIELYNTTLRNNKVDKDNASSHDGDASTLLDAPGVKNDEATAIPISKQSSISLLKVKTGKNANATISSVVFDKGYTSTTDYKAITNNTSLKLFVPQGEQAEKGKNYKATLTWELIDSI
ncbi:WxL domain-containing protein [Candidatus Enterococcus mansonii]|uniref:WxL domain-containing protein n=1 Tax=Candidatus Enterococcus mansonii TaxID=1834181 RepID=A0A242CE05_9ENTE|nr:WxL domain-containing protein [Enterococcus sp. 4G2_DIV0659]OTO08441.1 hypothetical protein A5880_001441 [Enterococcus sp. 4G2_DIV0659]